MSMQPLRRWFAGALATVLLLSGLHALAENAAEVRMRRDLAFLASDACEGRGPGTKGIDLAADYIAAQFKEAGLKPAGEDGTYFQPFAVTGEAKKGSPNTMRLVGPLGQEIELQEGKDFEVLGLSGSGTVTAPILFLGYGATVPDTYDDYDDIDVKDKIVVALRHTPRWNNKDLPFTDNPTQHAALVRKQSLAEANRAAAMVLVNDRSEAKDVLLPFSYVAKETSSGTIPSVHLRRATVDAIVRSSLGMSLEDIEAGIDRDLKPRSTALEGWTAKIETSVKRSQIPVKNVVGVLEGSGPLAKETVVIGAHYDHLGYGGRSSLAPDKNKKQIHYGADDNASGTTVLMELARNFADMPNRQGRRLVFIAFSAEEMGLLGSRHYCEKQPIFPLESTAAMVNLDMVGRMEPDAKTKKGKLMIQGTGTAKNFHQLVDKAAADFDFQIAKKDGGIGPSDHASFYRKKIPVLFFFTGTHKDYHRPSDTAEKINYGDMVQITSLAERMVQELAADPKRPEFVQVAGGAAAPTRPKGMPTLGIMPNYAEDAKGVLVGGVREKGPAEKGGIKAGDQIVEIAGKQITNIETYMVIMGQQRPGQSLEVGVIRAGKKLTLKVVPQ